MTCSISSTLINTFCVSFNSLCCWASHKTSICYLPSDSVVIVLIVSHDHFYVCHLRRLRWVNKHVSTVDDAYIYIYHWLSLNGCGIGRHVSRYVPCISWKQVTAVATSSSNSGSETNCPLSQLQLYMESYTF